MSDLYGIKVKGIKSAPKGQVWFVDEDMTRRWEEADKVFRHKWWSPLAWVRLWCTKIRVRRIAKGIIKNVASPEK